MTLPMMILRFVPSQGFVRFARMAVLAALVMAGLAAGPAHAQDDKLREAQNVLLLLGYSVGKPDGIASSRTVQAIESFQKSSNLPVTGKIDEKTMDALRTKRDSSLSQTLGAPDPARAARRNAPEPKPQAVPTVPVEAPTNLSGDGKAAPTISSGTARAMEQGVGRSSGSTSSLTGAGAIPPPIASRSTGSATVAAGAAPYGSYGDAPAAPRMAPAGPSVLDYWPWFAMSLGVLLFFYLGWRWIGSSVSHENPYLTRTAQGPSNVPPRPDAGARDGGFRAEPVAARPEAPAARPAPRATGRREPTL